MGDWRTDTLARMRQGRPLTLVQVPDAGHAPSLCDPVQVQCVARWLRSPEALPAEFTLP